MTQIERVAKAIEAEGQRQLRALVQKHARGLAPDRMPLDYVLIASAGLAVLMDPGDDAVVRGNAALIEVLKGHLHGEGIGEMDPTPALLCWRVMIADILS